MSINFFLILLTIELYFRKKYIYSKFIGFADYFNFFFILKLKNKLKNKNILCFNNTQLKIIKFFFPDNFSRKVIFTIPEKFSWNANSLLERISKSFIFQPHIIANSDNLFRSSHKTKKILLSLCNNKKISNNIINFLHKKYICIYVRHYNNKVNSLIPSARQTANFDKIYKIIDLLIKKKINIIVLGLKRELSVLRIKKFLGNKYNNKVFYFSELTDNYSIEDQLQIANNSVGYIGSATGHVTLFHYLNKKSVIFDSIKISKFHTSKAFLKNKIILYKKIKFKGQLVDCHIDYIKKSSNNKFINFKEVTFNELKFNICKIFKI
jgi:hypothetical protein